MSEMLEQGGMNQAMDSSTTEQTTEVQAVEQPVGSMFDNIDVGEATTEQPQAQTTSNWYDSFSEDVRSDPNITKFKSPEELLKSYKGLQNTVLNRLKADDVTMEELAPYLSEEQLSSLKQHKDVPNTPNDYALSESVSARNLPETSNVAINKAKEMAHKYGISNKVFQEFMDLEFSVADDLNKSWVKNNVGKIKEEFGDRFQEVGADVSNAVLKLGGVDAYNYLEKTRILTDPVLFKIMSKVADRMKGDQLPEGLNGFGSSGTVSNKDRLTAFFNSEKYELYRQGDPAATKELAALYKAQQGR